MATNNIKPFAGGSSANVTSQADFEALAALATGFQSGKASSAQINKVLRQSSLMAYVLAQFISDSAAVDVLDNGVPATVLANLKASMKALTPGRILGAPKVFTAATSYTPSAGTTAIVVQVVGGGGGGGGTPATSSSQNSVGSGGAAGGMAISYIPVSSLSTPVAVTVGIAGQGVIGAAGQKGGTSSFGSYISCTGGNGGLLGAAAASGAPYVLQSPPGGVATGGTILNVNGSPGGQATFITTSAGISGTGGSSPLGGSGGTGGSTASGGYSNSTGPGGGGGGSAAGSSASAQGGGSGGSGLVLIWELS